MRRVLKAQQAIDFHDECAVLEIRIPAGEGVAFVGVNDKELATRVVLRFWEAIKCAFENDMRKRDRRLEWV